MNPKHILLLDLDGLRPDVFLNAQREGKLPHIGRLFGGDHFDRSLRIENVAPAPSITFCSQACLFTGHHPAQHGIPGNQFFDRFGTETDKTPSFYAFDVGDTLEVDDAVKVFTHNLAGVRLQVPTFYERMKTYGLTSLVAGNMYGYDADTWIKPSLTKLGRFIKGGNLFGLSSAAYDGFIVEQVLDYLDSDGMPDILTMYFMGIDHDSHVYGPQAQAAALEVVDGLIGKLWDKILEKAQGSIFVSLFSDHGQIEVIPDDKHSLRIGFPFDREMGYFFDALGLDVHDYPGEDPDCDAVMALNGGIASVYLHNKTGHWWDQPEFARDVAPIGKAFWEAHASGKYAADLEGAIAAVLIRNVEKEGWNAPYHALTPQGEIVPLTQWVLQQPQDLYLDPVNRLDNYSGRFCGDLLLISNYADGFYFGGELTGMHGGLHPEDSAATLLYGWHGISEDEWSAAAQKIHKAIAKRCHQENGRMSSTPDMLTGVEAVMKHKQ